MAEVQKDPAKAHEQTGDNPKLFAAIVLFAQVLFCILFAVGTDYESANYVIAADATAEEIAETTAAQQNLEKRVTRVYGMFQDVHVMIFIGFGFLMTFLKKYGFSSVAYNFIVSALAIQWSILALGYIEMIWHADLHKVVLTVDNLVKGDFAAGAILISFGAVLGRVTPTQLIVMGFLEILFYGVNECIGVIELEVVDMGGSIFVHTFGAYFGLGVSWMLGKPNAKQAAERNASNYNSDMFAMIGTIFLWMFWPSFNGALCPTENFSRERVVINTVLALSASCVTAFACSRYFTAEMKFDMVHIQNASLAGGVAVGSSSDLVIGPYGAILVGITAGAVSVLGYIYISPWLEEKFNLVDTCGVHNLHGIPGVMGGIGGAISAATTSETEYGTAVTSIFAARDTRSAGEQGGYQFAAVCVCLAMSITGGLITGWILKNFTPETEQFHDKSHWELPEEHVAAAEGEKEKLIPEADIELVDVDVKA